MTGPVLLIVVSLGTVIAYWNGHNWSDMLARSGWIVGCAIAFSMLYLWLYGASSITLTSTELTVRRFGWKQSMPRADVGEVVSGEKDWSRGRGAEPGFYWFITKRDGSRFVALPQSQWPGGGIEELARVLDIEPREPKSLNEERSLAPWWMRHIFLAAIAIGLVLTVVVGLIWWGAVTWQDARRAAAEQSAERAYAESLEPRLTTSEFPSLRKAEHDAPTSPLRVSGYAENPEHVLLRPSVNLSGADSEIPATETLELLDLQCDYTATASAVSVSGVNYSSDDDFGYDRTVSFECGTDGSSLEKWLLWVEKNSFGENVSAIDVTKESSYDGDPQQPLEIMIVVTDYSDADFRAMVDHLCTYSDADSLSVRVDEEVGSQAAPVNCEVPEYSVGEWENSNGR